MPTHASERSTETVATIIQRVPHHGFDPRLRGVSGTIQFDVADKGSWRLRIDDGRTDLLEGAGPAELTIASDEADFAGLLRGATNLITAVLRGDIEVEGDLSLALRFHGIVAGGLPAHEVAS